jgi:hypothetical protein
MYSEREYKLKLHHTKYKKNYRQYILDCVYSDDKELTTDQEKINYIFDRFNSEYSFEIKRVGKLKAMSKWLSGLALPIDYWNEDIVKLAVKMGSINPNPSDKLYAKVCNNYWDFMANIILGFESEVK